VRRENAALQFDRDLEFHAADNPQLLAYTKVSPDGRNRVLVVVNLDPHQMQHGWIAVPAERLGSPTAEPFQVRDLLTDATFTWRGERHYIRLDPASASAHVFCVDDTPAGGARP
jgi:starch synthase (maltosyl-transferring)